MDIKQHQLRVVVIRLSSLGDLVLTTAFLEALFASLSEKCRELVKVTWVTSSEYQALFNNHPKVDQVLVAKRYSGLSGLYE